MTIYKHARLVKWRFICQEKEVVSLKLRIRQGIQKLSISLMDNKETNDEGNIKLLCIGIYKIYCVCWKELGILEVYLNNWIIRSEEVPIGSIRLTDNRYDLHKTWSSGRAKPCNNGTVAGQYRGSRGAAARFLRYKKL